MSVYRCYSQKRAGFDVEAQGLCKALREQLGVQNLKSVTILNRYDADQIDAAVYEQAKGIVFSEPQVDAVTDETFAAPACAHSILAVEALPGQFDQRADSAAQCIQLMAGVDRPLIAYAKVYILEGELSQSDLDKIRHYLINPVESREATMDKPETLVRTHEAPDHVATVDGFTAMDEAALSALLDELIGKGWRRDPMELERLLPLAEDETVLRRLLEVKQENKDRLCRLLWSAQGLELDSRSIFDVQIKRFHEYKRQQMNALYVIDQYLEIKAGRLPARPITVLFGGKAAPAYVMAKDIIHLILTLQALIEADPQVRPWLRVAMVENYNVSWAEVLIPACDLSEQISLASKEASGTGNMKLMANGAVTLGTMDGANVEIAQLVGPENIYTFGASSDQVIAYYAQRTYSARDHYHRPAVERLVDFLVSPQLLTLGDPARLSALWSDLKTKDWFMTLLDVEDYIRAKAKALRDYECRTAWAEKMLVNIARSGYFSSDRTIRQYNEDIWHLN